MDEEYVIMQLHHERNTKVVVKSTWILNYCDIRPMIETPGKEAQPAFFFYNEDPCAVPTFSISAYKKLFDPTTASIYKGYIANRIYCESHKWRQMFNRKYS